MAWGRERGARLTGSNHRRCEQLVWRLRRAAGTTRAATCQARGHSAGEAGAVRMAAWMARGRCARRAHGRPCFVFWQQRPILFQLGSAAGVPTGEPAAREGGAPNIDVAEERCVRAHARGSERCPRTEAASPASASPHTAPGARGRPISGRAPGWACAKPVPRPARSDRELDGMEAQQRPRVERPGGAARARAASVRRRSPFAPANMTFASHALESPRSTAGCSASAASLRRQKHYSRAGGRWGVRHRPRPRIAKTAIQPRPRPPLHGLPSVFPVRFGVHPCRWGMVGSGHLA